MPNGHRAQRAFDRQVIDFQAPVVTVARESFPPVQRIEDRPARD
jgi:hypothetical protein